MLRCVHPEKPLLAKAANALFHVRFQTSSDDRALFDFDQGQPRQDMPKNCEAGQSYCGRESDRNPASLAL